ncbi:MAG: tyrosine-type recombinase/integrase [Pseudomonadota bacterium]
MRMKLTDAVLRKYRPGTGRDEIFDDSLGGFGVRITAASKSFFFIRRINGEKVRFSLGKYPPAGVAPSSTGFTSLADARRQAFDILDKIEKGGDPREEYAVRKQAKAEEQPDTFASAAKLFLEQYPKAKGKPLSEPTLKGYRWALGVPAPATSERTIRKKKPNESPTMKWAARPVSQITAQDIGKILDRFEADGHLASARLFRAYLHKFFGWCAEPRRKLVPANPVSGITLDAKPQDFKRDRVLPISELQAVLKATDGLVKGLEAKGGKKVTGEAQRAFIWTLVLLGQRREETSLMKWSDLMLEGDTPIWKIPAENTKNGRPHEVELSPEAVEIISKLPRLGDFVFTTGGAKPISGFSKIKNALDKGLAEAGAKLEPWRLHDLRRSFSTGLGNLGFAPHVIEAAINHISGGKAGVSGLYNHSKYADDCRRAFAGWAKAVTVPEAAGNVVQLRAGA